MKLTKIDNVEIAHLYEPATGNYIYSKGNVFFGSIHNKRFKFKIRRKSHFGLFRLLIKSRLLRRFFRLDKSNAAYCSTEKLIYIVYQSDVYYFCLINNRLNKVHSLRQSRNTLHMGLLIKNGYVYIGEYGDSSHLGVPIWKGRREKWEKIFEFKPNAIRHIHGIYYDKYDNSIWVTTGDYDGQCFLVKTKDDFRTVEYIGDGGQSYRTVNLLFTSNKVFWAMDSPTHQNYCYILDKSSMKVQKQCLKFLDGPVWYMKALVDGFIIQTSVEKGDGVSTNKAKVYFSRDLTDWSQVKSFTKDILPAPLFKNGVVSFADGLQYKSNFVLFCEGLKSVDGNAYKCSIGEVN